MTNKMNITNLRTFVESLNKLPDEVQNNKMDMISTKQPVCGTPGCHAGLVSIVAECIPELKSLYFEHYDYDPKYDYSRWADTLARFLGFDNRYDIAEWADNNRELWNNDCGLSMFTSGVAFGRKKDKFLHSVIIKHWTKVLRRVEQLNKKGELQNG